MLKQGERNLKMSKLKLENFSYVTTKSKLTALNKMLLTLQHSFYTN